MLIREALKKYPFNKHGLSDETIIQLLGMTTIADDQIADLQYYINQAKWEADALIREARREFGK